MLSMWTFNLFTVLFFLIINAIAGLNIVGVTYDTQSIHVDNRFSFETATFLISFDQGTQFLSKDTNDKGDHAVISNSRPNTTTTTTTCFPPLKCSPPLYFSANLKDLITLSCPSEEVLSSPHYKEDFDGASPPSYLMLFAGSVNEPLLNFFSQNGHLDSSYTTTVDSTKIFAIMLLSYTEKGVQYLFGGRIRKVKADLISGKCTIRFPAVTNSSFYISGVQDSGPFSGEYSNIQAATPVSCSYFPTLGISQSISNTITKMTSTETYEDLQELQFHNALLASSNNIVACTKLTESFMTRKEERVTFPGTTDCTRNPNDPLYSRDPCCNTTLQFYYCCAPSQKEVTVQLLNTVDISKAKCKNAIQSSSYLNDYVVNTNSAEDLTKGCRATAEKIVNEAIFYNYTNYIDTCLNRIYGDDIYGLSQLRACTKDEDCETYCEPIGTCFIDVVNPDEAMMKCHMRLIAPFVVRLLQVRWGLSPSTSPDQFRQEYATRLSTPNCVGMGASEYTWDRTATIWKHDKEGCLNSMICSYDTYASSEEECREPGNSCVYKIRGYPFSISFSPFCYASAMTVEACSAIPGAVFDANKRPYFCQLPLLDTRDKCIQSDICSSTNHPYLETQCEAPMCIGNLTKEQCITDCSESVLKKWNSNVESGDGFCKISVANSSSCAENNGTWWGGRSWMNGLYNTKEQCDKGACETGLVYYPDPYMDCSQSFGCSQTCRNCISTRSTGKTLCYANNMTSCDCDIAGGVYNPSHDICLFSYGNRGDCNAHQLTWASCTDLNEATCRKCTAGEECPQHYNLLECDYSWRTDCISEQQCLSSGGVCNDRFFNTHYCSQNSAILEHPDCQGSCLHDLIPLFGGNWGCPTGELYTALGCIDRNIFYRSDCESRPGYWWKNAFDNKQDCESDMGCLGLASANLNRQNETECSNCKSKYQPIYNWIPGAWVPADKLELTYVENKWMQTNKWENTLDIGMIRDTINSVVAGHFSLAVRTESMCQYNPLLQAVTSIACDCASDPSAPPQCYTGNTRTISIGIQRLYAGIADFFKAGPILINIFASTVPVSAYYVDVDIDIASASQFKKQQSLSTNALSSSFDANPYAIVLNENAAVVAQLAGDGVIFSFLPAETKTRATGFKLATPMRVCVQIRSDISKSEEFTTPDFAVTSDFKRWIPLDSNATNGEDGICFNTTTEGAYFPIWRVDGDWRSRTAKPLIDNVTLLVFIYLFGCIFVILAFISAYQVYISWSNLRGQKAKFNLGVVLFFFMSVFCIVRALYLFILPSGILDDNEAAKYFLSEAPQFFFFSVYSVIIFLWAEISRLVVSRETFLKHFKWPFIFTNIGLYVLFVVVVAVYQNISESRQTDLKRAYVFILAGCCVAAMIAFNVYGKKLITVQMDAQKYNKKLTTKTLFRLALTSIVSTLTLAAQIVFLFVTTYTKVSSAVALVAYGLTEIIPCATLIYTLRPLSRRLKKKQPTSTEMRSKHRVSSNVNSGMEQSVSLGSSDSPRSFVSVATPL